MSGYKYTDDEIAAANALIRWMDSQEIEPFDAVPILAMAMVVACISLDRENAKLPKARRRELLPLTERVLAARDLVARVFEEMLENK